VTRGAAALPLGRITRIAELRRGAAALPGESDYRNLGLPEWIAGFYRKLVLGRWQD